jgi:hypothetical protein
MPALKEVFRSRSMRASPRSVARFCATFTVADCSARCCAKAPRTDSYIASRLLFRLNR